jgi:hypothetical protein
MSNGRAWSPEHTKLMILLNRQGCSDHVIAGATGHDVDVVGRHRRAMGLEPNHRTAYSTLAALPPSALEGIAMAARMAA